MITLLEAQNAAISARSLSEAMRMAGHYGGLIGGKAKTERKRIAVRLNGTKGGRPRKPKAP